MSSVTQASPAATADRRWMILVVVDQTRRWWT
jgi:hypothetical protein